MRAAAMRDMESIEKDLAFHTLCLAVERNPVIAVRERARIDELLDEWLAVRPATV
jgi:hypothetical protein